MADNESKLIPHNVVLFELIAALCFSRNKNLWQLEDDDYLLLTNIAKGSSELDLSENILSSQLTKFFTGLFLFAFYIYENIGNQYISVTRNKNTSIIEILFYDGEKFKFDVNQYDEVMCAFFTRSMKLLLSASNTTVSKDTFVNLNRMFNAARERLEKEASFFKKIIRMDDISNRVLNRNSFSINLFSTVFASIPSTALNQIMIIIGNEIKEDLEVSKESGAVIKAKSFFTTDTVDIHELFNKVKVLLGVYQVNKEMFFSLFENYDTKKQIYNILEDKSVNKKLRENILETLEGQYLPRINSIKAFQKIIAD